VIWTATPKTVVKAGRGLSHQQRVKPTLVAGVVGIDAQSFDPIGAKSSWST